MKRIFGMCAVVLLLCGQATRVAAQEPSKDTKAADSKSGEAKSAEANPPKEESFVTDHTIRIGRQTVAYKATASTQRGRASGAFRGTTANSSSITSVPANICSSSIA